MSMTDNEIIKAFEYCPQTRACTHAECPLFGSGETVAECAAELNEKVRDLIQRQQERIERLKDNLDAVLKERTDLDVDRVVERLSNNYRIVHSDEDLEWNRAITKAIEVVRGGE